MLLKAYMKAEQVVGDFKAHLKRLREDESGASLIEYSLLIGLIAAAAVTSIVAIGAWIGPRWTALENSIGA